MGELSPGARRRIGLASLAAAMAAALMLAWAGPRLNQPLFDLFQTLTPAPRVSPWVHVVVIDPESLRALGGWPWSRFYLARLAEQIADRGAAAIGFDILMPERDRLDPAQFASLYSDLPPDLAARIGRLPSMDAVFARVIGRSPVVLARAGVSRGSFDFAGRSDGALPPEAEFTGPVPPGLLQFPAVVANLPLLDGAALGHGLVNGERDPDGLLRRVPLVARAAGALTPGFALELVRVAQGATRISLESRGGRLTAVRIGRLKVPATPDGQLLLRFGDWRTIPTTSAVDVLRRGAPADLFAHQVVLVGLASAGASEVTSTPRSPAELSVYVQAQAVDAILRGAGLARPTWAAIVEWSLGLVLALAAWLAAPRLTPGAAALAASAAVALALAASWLAFRQNLLVDPLPMLAPAAAAAIAAAVLVFVEGRRARARLRATLEEQRRRADEHQQLLINELNHRVKNTLATVQSIAMQTSRNTQASDDFAQVFTARIGALASAHEMLSEASWEGASLAEVLGRTLAPHLGGDGKGRVSASGPPIHLGPNAAVTLNMAFHELATNAAKYGALSGVVGRVDVTWRLEADADLAAVVIDWRESGGPAVAEPVRRGFGSRLIEQALAREFAGDARLIFDMAGVRCEMRLPLSAQMRAAA